MLFANDCCTAKLCSRPLQAAKLLIGAVMLVSLVACGGGGGGGGAGNGSGGGSGGGSGSSPTVPAPTITDQPDNTFTVEGQSVLFTVTATGSAITYQWQRDGVDIPGATEFGYSLISPTLSDNGAQFSVTISNTGGTTRSATVALIVNPTYPGFITGLSNQQVLAGNAATFTATAFGTAPLTYSWYRNGLPIAGATSSSYTTPNTTLADSGASYQVNVNSPYGSSYSIAMLVVDPVPNLISIDAHPINAAHDEGEIAELSVSASGTGPLQYQWRRNGTSIPGAYEATLKIAPTTLFDIGSYDVLVSNSISQTASNAASLAIQSAEISLVLGRVAGWGDADGPSLLASFGCPSGIATDSSGNFFVTDTLNHTVRRISTSGIVTTIAGRSGQYGSSDGSGSTARFNAPTGIVIDSADNLFVMDNNSETIRKITPLGVVTTLAGAAGVAGSSDGTGNTARFDFPQVSICSGSGSGLAIDDDDNLYVADGDNHTIRSVSPTGVTQTLAGMPGIDGDQDGQGTAARFNYPKAIAFGPDQQLYITDLSQKIRRMTLAGSVSTAWNVQWGGIHAITHSADGTMFFTAWDRVGEISTQGQLRVITGNITGFGSVNGRGTAATFERAVGIVRRNDNSLIVTDRYGLRKIDAEGAVSTFAGNLGAPIGFADGPARMAEFNSIAGIVSDTSGNIYFVDTFNRTIRMLNAAGVVSTIAGNRNNGAGSIDGIGSNASFYQPFDMARANDGTLFVVDAASHNIRTIATNGTVSTLAGGNGIANHADGQGSAARFNTPRGIALASNGDLYVADTNNHVIRKVTPAGAVTTFAGAPGNSGYVDANGTSARFNQPDSLVFDSSDNLFVTESSGTTVRKITPTGDVSTFAGAATFGSTDGVGAAARFSFLNAIDIDEADNLYVVDRYTVRKITPTAVVTTVVGNHGSWGPYVGDLPGTLSTPREVAVKPSASGTELLISNGPALLKAKLP